MTAPVQIGNATLHLGDCLEVMARMIADGVTVDSVCCDPPYHLTSIVKRFANADPAKEHFARTNPTSAYRSASAGFMGKKWDGGDIAFRPETWRLCYDLLKPGGHLLAFGLPRTFGRMQVAVEDAGFEIRDTVCWLFGSGFPKSHNVSKGIDRAAGAERKVIGPGKYHNPNARQNWCSSGVKEVWETSPATAAAREWQGWGTATKPAYEPIIYARKPLTAGPTLDKLLFETQNLIGGVLCQLMLFANNADKTFASNLSVSGEACGSVLMLAAVLRGSQSAEWCELMATRNSPETASMCLSIASSWQSIYSEVSHQRNTFTISTGIALTTALKTLNSCLSAIIPASIIKVVSRPLGEQPSAEIAEGNLNDTQENWTLTPRHIARVLASVRQELNTANDAVPNFVVAVNVANSALRHVLTVLPTTNGERQFSPNAEFIVMARKPLSESSVAANVLRHGTGAINVDGTRIGTERRINPPGSTAPRNSMGDGWREDAESTTAVGRWPANLAHDGSPEVMEAFAAFGESKSSDTPILGGARSDGVTGWKGQPHDGFSDSGTAARFFYSAKAGPDDRFGSRHPTIKPIALMRWLVRMVTPPGGTVLDPFAGSGTTGVACLAEGFPCILIEREAEYFADIQERLKFYAGEGGHSLASKGRKTAQPGGGGLPLFGESS